MLLRITILALLTSFSTLSLHAESVFPAAYAYTLTGKIGTNDRYGDSDHAHFEAGDILTLVGEGWVQQQTLTAKGVAIFDLQANGLGEQLKAAGDNKVLISFILDRVQGEPRPLRVEYIGATDVINSKRSLTAQFERSPIHTANRVLTKDSAPGVTVVDATPLLARDLKQRYLVIRFEQEGDRRGIHSKDGSEVSPDLYIFRQGSDSVRLTITDQKAANGIASQYTKDGYYNPIQDMPANPIQDMPKNPIQDMPTNPITDMPANPIQDMPENILSDMPSNLINDGPVSNNNMN
ncbi:hypothetical protein [Cerasicoccus arenae]|uniref:Uncharacterized protein n=1 Tax=Cerasicoccus arenae TaxID=424488 RepID=A0A8J3GDM3_9BACT|nr:hypothetical protein [Cerasicoccus arenae]MBK1858150.1 hypothetical protein [Cerasicoccus arenae]GHB96792.1 hypothetical protein GCM10007047_10920 [Cerasicoccus arenae]